MEDVGYFIIIFISARKDLQQEMLRIFHRNLVNITFGQL
jgi:hypothetical protein